MKENHYTHHIAKDLLQWMPIARFEERSSWSIVRSLFRKP